MFKGNWRNGVALGIIWGISLSALIGIVVLGLNYCPDSPCEYQGAHSKEPDNKKYGLTNPFWPDVDADPHPADDDEHPDYYDHQDLDAQQAMADATNSIVALTGASLVLSLIGAVAIMWTLVETRRVGGITRDSSRDETRAYVSVDAIEFFWGGKRRNNPQCRITIFNSGQTPAKWYQARVVAITPPMGEFPKAFPSDLLPHEFGRKWNSISSGASLDFPFYLHDQVEDIQLSWRGNEGGPKKWLIVVGEIKYETFFGEVFRSQFYFGAPHGFRNYDGELIDSEEKHGLVRTDTYREIPIPLSRMSIDLETFIREDKS